ncbi:MULTISPECIES: energy-coupling factor ABC transporter ATP-binding protein [Actinosynnema]|uniref:Cobalt ABC transporter ATP-binding protein n=1 Tax=Actinosynnema pretiosum TaxID=42197 RepID=A0A290Z9V8_9PSEU|nr:ABC transporter ATP-binding protein [Actinosynnema pretiosum]ATE55776.1 cobalt ABC transporter ATP-binding protein [Actinosynnema pretiosum]
MIEFRGVSFAYPATSGPALSEVDLSVPAGQVCGVVGASGAGKSTLAAAIAGMVPHVTGGALTGSVTVAGRSVAGTPLAEVVTDVGLVVQDPFNQMSGAKFTVREELAFGLENLGVERAEMVRRIEEVLSALGIGHLAERSPFTLSGGQQQLVAIGAVLVMRPRVVVLDEPTSQLDPDSASLVFGALDALRRDGITVVLVEHRTERLAELADRVVVLAGGRVVADGAPAEVFTDPRLPGLGVSTTRYTRAARRAAERGLWPRERPLPVLLPEAVSGFSVPAAADPRA